MFISNDLLLVVILTLFLLAQITHTLGILDLFARLRTTQNNRPPGPRDAEATHQTHRSVFMY